VYLLNKYLKCSVWRLALRYDIYIYVVRLQKFNGRGIRVIFNVEARILLFLKASSTSLWGPFILLFGGWRWAVPPYMGGSTSDRKTVFILKPCPLPVGLLKGVFPLHFQPKFLAHSAYLMFVLLLKVVTVIIIRRTLK